MPTPTTQQQSESTRAWQWLMNGWHALRDKAVNALTYFSPTSQSEPNGSQRWGVLATDVYEHKDSITVELELPGMEKADLSVEVHDTSLLISGEKRFNETREEGSLIVTQRAFGQFQRVIPLPCEVTSEGTEAVYKKGVLSVTMPKERSRSSRTITVQGS